MKEYKPYLMDILNECEYLRDKLIGLDYETFAKDETLKRAFVRSLEIIGEAVKNIPKNVKDSYPETEWKKIAGMRDKLIHGYFKVDYELVWDVVVNKIPKLEETIKKIVKMEESRDRAVEKEEGNEIEMGA